MKVVARMLGSLLTAVVLSGCVTANMAQLDKNELGPPAQSTPRGEAMGRYIASVFLERTGNMEAALEELEKVPALDRTAVTPSLRLIRTYVRAQEFEKARDLAETTAEQLSDNPAIWIMLGEIYHQLKQFDKAIEAFSKAVKLNPENVHGYGALAEVLEATNDLVAALDSYETLVKMNPNSAPLQFQLGATLIRINDREGARVAFQKALELNPGFSQARYMLGILDLELDRNEDCVAALSQHLDQHPGDVRSVESLVGALGRLQRFDEALTRLQGIGKDAWQPKHEIIRAFLQLQAGRGAEAEQTNLTGAPIFGTIMRQLAKQAQGKAVEPAVDSLDAIDSDVDEEASANLNDITYLFGKEKGAAWLAERLATLQQGAPTSRVLSLVRSRLLYSLERFDEGVALLEPLYTAETSDKTLLFYLADGNEKRKRYDEAEKYLKRYLELDPANPEMLNFLGFMYADKNMKLDEAEVLIRKALETDPDNAYYLDSLGWVFYRQGKGKQAIDFIQRAIYGMSSDDAILRDHLGDAYLLDGQVEKAVAEWKRARRLDPKLPGVQEKLDKHGAK